MSEETQAVIIKEMAKRDQLKQMIGQHVFLHITSDAIIDGVLESIFHPYDDETQPLTIYVRGAGDTYAHVQVRTIGAIDDNEIFLKETS